jgi:hypothetical protein
MPAPIPGWRDAPFNVDGTQDLTHEGSPGSWNTLILNGIDMPGMLASISAKHALVSFHGRASGKKPGAPTIRGQEPGIVAVEIRLIDNEDWDEFVDLAEDVLPCFTKGGSNPASAGAIKANHPLLRSIGIQWVIVRDLELIGPKGGGPVSVKFNLEQTQVPGANIQVKQAIPKPTGLENAPTIAIAGEAPRPPNRRDFSRKPVQNAR